VNAEVEAEAAGTLRRIVAPVGSRVAVLGLVALIGDADEPLPAEATWGVSAAAESPHPGPLPLPGEGGLPALTPALSPSGRGGAYRPHPHPLPEGEGALAGPLSLRERARVRASDDTATRPTASPAARRLARERGIALDRIRGTGPRGEITRADVDAAARTGPAPPPRRPPVTSIRLRGVAQARCARLPRLILDAKIDLYRRHGAQIGTQVRIEPGALIIAAHIRIGDASSIGADTLIECDPAAPRAAGRLRPAHPRALPCDRDRRCAVVEGRRGDRRRWQRRARGIPTGRRRLLLRRRAYLNTCHPSPRRRSLHRLARHALHHSHWQSVLHGYPSLFAPIDVGDHVFIGNNAFVFPGVRIGAGATVVVNSFVAVHVATEHPGGRRAGAGDASRHDTIP